MILGSRLNFSHIQLYHEDVGVILRKRQFSTFLVSRCDLFSLALYLRSFTWKTSYMFHKKKYFIDIQSLTTTLLSSFL